MSASSSKSSSNRSKSPSFTIPIPRCLSLSISPVVHLPVSTFFASWHSFHPFSFTRSHSCAVSSSNGSFSDAPMPPVEHIPSNLSYPSASVSGDIRTIPRGRSPDADSMTAGGIVRRPALNTHLLIALAQTILLPSSPSLLPRRTKCVIVYSHLLSQLSTRVHISYRWYGRISRLKLHRTAPSLIVKLPFRTPSRPLPYPWRARSIPLEKSVLSRCVRAMSRSE